MAGRIAMTYKIITIDQVEYFLVPVDRPQTKTPLESLGLPVSAVNALTTDGIRNLEDVLSMKEVELLQVPNFGRKYLSYLKEKVKEVWPHLDIGSFSG